MNTKHLLRRILSVLTTFFLAAATVIPMVIPVYAQNSRFISEVMLAAGKAAAENLEKDGWSVMMTGLNRDVSADRQVYLAYKTNTGDPITNVMIANDAGESLIDHNGISYDRASETDVDEGVGGGAGCLYYTRDKKAGTPLVGFDILRSKEEPLYPITNDGAEIVRTVEGVPADLEMAAEKLSILRRSVTVSSARISAKSALSSIRINGTPFIPLASADIITMLTEISTAPTIPIPFLFINAPQT